MVENNNNFSFQAPELDIDLENLSSNTMDVAFEAPDTNQDEVDVPQFDAPILNDNQNFEMPDFNINTEDSKSDDIPENVSFAPPSNELDDSMARIADAIKDKMAQNQTQNNDVEEIEIPTFDNSISQNTDDVFDAPTFEINDNIIDELNNFNPEQDDSTRDEMFKNAILLLQEKTQNESISPSINNIKADLTK